jgi:hypothetical protein
VCIAIFVVNEALSSLMRSTFGISDLLLLLLLLRDGGCIIAHFQFRWV